MRVCIFNQPTGKHALINNFEEKSSRKTDSSGIGWRLIERWVDWLNLGACPIVCGLILLISG